MQKKYWRHMVQVKGAIYYLDAYAEDSYKKDRYIKIFCAVVSSSSIAAWAIWNELSYIWGVIIAISQVINAIKDYLPYEKRLKILYPLIGQMRILYGRMEKDWYKVASGKMTKKEINKLLFLYKKEYYEIENLCLNEEILLENEKFVKEATRKLDEYFEIHFEG